MNASSPQQLAAEPIDEFDDGFDEKLPARTRARYLTPLTALLMALILGGVGFYTGIRVEKTDVSSGTGSSALAGAFSGAPGGASTASSGSGGGGGLPTQFTGGRGGFASPLGNATIGSVTSRDRNTLYVQETGGNTVKVNLSRATTLTKSVSVSKNKVKPGDSVVIRGSKSANGTVQATSVSDSGASSSPNAGSSTSSSSTGSTGASSAVSSLFGGG